MCYVTGITLKLALNLMNVMLAWNEKSTPTRCEVDAANKSEGAYLFSLTGTCNCSITWSMVKLAAF